MSAHTLVLTVAGQPVPKGRPRVFRGRGITPQATRDAEKRIADAFTTKYKNFEPITSEIDILLTFYMQNRKRTDYDNLAKLVTDALNGLAYADDSQIVKAVVFKIMPSRRVPNGKGRTRKRRAGDLKTTEQGRPYSPHTEILITAHEN